MPRVAQATTSETADQLRSMPYRDYLRSNHWLKLRQVVLEIRPLCIECRMPATEIHHLTYERRGRERVTDLVSLCTKCHRQAHKVLYQANEAKRRAASNRSRYRRR